MSRHAAHEGDRLWLCVIDFEDAFYSLGLAPSEWPYLIARHPEGGFVSFRTALCGGAACPLVWGRGAAYLGRSGAAILPEAEARHHTYVDDPAFAVQGATPLQARLRLSTTLWWWA